MPSVLEQAALDAAAAAAAKLVADRRAVLASFCATKVDVSQLTVAESTDVVTIFTDGVVHLAVNDSVHLVTGAAGNWTDKAGPLADLAALADALAA